VSPKLSGRPSEAIYHHGPPTCRHRAATGRASRTWTASKGSSFGWPPAAHGTSQPGSVRTSETTRRARRTEWLAAGAFDKLVEEAIAGYDGIIGLDLSAVAVGKVRRHGTQAIATAALPWTRPVRADEGLRQALRVLVASRDQMTQERMMNVNSLNALLRVHEIGIDALKPPSEAQIREALTANHARMADGTRRTPRAGP